MDTKRPQLLGDRPTEKAFVDFASQRPCDIFSGAYVLRVDKDRTLAKCKCSKLCPMGNVHDLNSLNSSGMHSVEGDVEN